MHGHHNRHPAAISEVWTGPIPSAFSYSILKVAEEAWQSRSVHAPLFVSITPAFCDQKESPCFASVVGVSMSTLVVTHLHIGGRVGSTPGLCDLCGQNHGSQSEIFRAVELAPLLRTITGICG